MFNEIITLSAITAGIGARLRSLSPQENEGHVPATINEFSGCLSQSTSQPTCVGSENLDMNPRLWTLLSLLVLSLLIVNCGSEESVGSSIGTGMTLMQPIIGGHAILDDDYRTVGALVASFPGYESQPFCTGTLLAPDVVLTASHCLDAVEEFRSDGVDLGFSLANDIRLLDDEGQSAGFSTFKHISKHPHYSSDWIIPPARLEACNNPPYEFVADACASFDVCLKYTSDEPGCLNDVFESFKMVCEPYREEACSTGSITCVESSASWCYDLAGYVFGFKGLTQQADIGLFFLDTPINNVTLARLFDHSRKQQLTPGQQVDIVGYGQQSPDPDTPATGQKMAAVARVREVGSYEVNIGGDVSGIQQCYGDSGGPAFVRVKQGGSSHTILTGVVSRSYESTTCDKGGINTRASPYLEWIQSEMTRGCDQGLRKSCESHPQVGIFIKLPDPERRSNTDEASGGCAATQTNLALFPLWVTGLLLSVFRARARRKFRPNLCSGARR